MSVAVIGGINVDIMRGLPALLRLRTETWVVPGLDGYGAQTLGKGDAEFDLATILYVTGATPSDDANTHIAACLALQGTVISLTDDRNDVYTGILVVKVDTTNAKKPLYYKGAKAVRAEISWKMVMTT